MRKSKLTDNSLSKGKQTSRMHPHRKSPKPMVFGNRSPQVRLQKYLNTTLNLPTEKPFTNRDSVESRRTTYLNKNIISRKLLYHSSKEAHSNKKKTMVSKSREKLSSSGKVKRSKKEVEKVKANLKEEQEEYLIKENPEDEKQKILEKIDKALDEHLLQQRAMNFQECIQSISKLTLKIDQSLSHLADSKQKTIIKKYKSISTDIGTRCLNILYDRVQTADVSMTTSERIELDIREKYEKKIKKLIKVIEDKQKKEIEVNKLIYFLRKSGVDIDEYWRRSKMEERRCKTQMELRFGSDI